MAINKITNSTGPSPARPTRIHHRASHIPLNHQIPRNTRHEPQDDEIVADDDNESQLDEDDPAVNKKKRKFDKISHSLGGNKKIKSKSSADAFTELAKFIPHGINLWSPIDHILRVGVAVHGLVGLVESNLDGEDEAEPESEDPESDIDSDDEENSSLSASQKRALIVSYNAMLKHTPELGPYLQHLQDTEDTESFHDLIAHDGDIVLNSKQLPAFLYDWDVFDPEDPEIGLFHGHISVRVAHAIFTSPSSAPTGKMSPPMVAYSVVQAYFALCAQETWRRKDGEFNLNTFYNRILDLLNDPDDIWAKNTLKWWTQQVFGESDAEEKKKKAPVDPEDDDFAKLKERRKARADDQLTPESETLPVSPTASSSDTIVRS
ncbi:hypothetical protein C8J56DRAFT_1083871, partial [Mycena floridula]